MDSQEWSPRVEPQGVDPRWVRLGVGLWVRGTGVGLVLVSPRWVGSTEPSGMGWVGPRVGYQGLGPMGMGTKGVAPEDGGRDKGLAPMTLVLGRRQGVDLGDRGAGLGPRLLEGSRLVCSRGGLV